MEFVAGVVAHFERMVQGDGATVSPASSALPLTIADDHDDVMNGAELGKMPKDGEEEEERLDICLLCTSTADAVPPLDSDQAVELRAHLVRRHAEFVAYAFLHPKPTDPIHVWLMTCADYNTVDQQPTGEDEEDEAVDTNEETTGGRGALDEVLAVLFSGELVPENDGVIQKNKRRPTKRPAPVASGKEENGGDVSGSRSKQHKELELNEVSSGRPEAWALFENAEELASATGLLAQKGKSGNSRGQAYDDEDEMAGEEEREGEEGEEEDGEVELPTPAPPGTLIDDRTCHLCWEECRYPGRHIAQKHLKKPLYECPVCEGFGSYEGCTVMKHIHKVHPDTPNVQPISNLEKYSAEIRRLQASCFPNRPMKLARSLQSTRPRERHHCKLCNVQVAQSDRQRHVYHKHLRKERLFQCPLCNFSSNYDVHRIKWHIKWHHKQEDASIEPISHETEFREEIDALNEECFPGWQHRRKPFWWLENEEAAARMEAVKAKARASAPMSVSGTAANSASASPSRAPCPASPEEDDEETAKEEIKKVNEWTCKLCFKEFKPSSNFLRHVAKEHMHIPLYQCPICEGQGGQDAYEIRAHMQKVHGSSDQQPISNLEKHADEIQRVYMQCFPGRKLKMPPGVSGGTSAGSTRSNGSGTPPTITSATVSTPPSVPPLRLRSSAPSMVLREGDRSETPEGCSSGRGGTTRDDERVQCQQCMQEMKTEDRQIHVYRHHLKEPRLYECPLCDFSHHACSSDVRSHIKYTHRENSEMLPKANLLEFSEKIAEWNERCFPGWINRRLPSAVLEDFNRCRLCDEDVRQTSRHIAEAHLRIPLHQCPLCEYGAAESRLVRRHMKNNHKKKELKGLEPIANVVERRADFSALHDKCFPGRPKRLSNITISDEGRRAKCRLCGGTISRKKRMGHLLEKHIAKPAFRCSECDFASSHDEEAVAEHVRDVHDGDATTISQLDDLVPEIERVVEAAFPDWKPTAEDYIMS